MALRTLHTSTALTLSAFAIVACSSGSSSGSSSSGGSNPVVPPPPPAERVAPTVSFSPSSLTVTPGQTGASTVSATDNVGVTSGPTVTCTNGGSFSANTFTAPQAICFDRVSVCTATASDAAGNVGTAQLSVTMPKQTLPSGALKISGQITFDLVPFNTSTNGLNYSAITPTSARGVTVEAVDAAGALLSCGVTDSNGEYEVSVAPNTDVRIRARAEMVSDSVPSWEVKVLDNTSSSALYAITGGIASSGSTDSTRNLNAVSGWGGSGYTSTRAAAPFAILDPIYDAIQKIVAVDPNVVLPTADFNWSTRNRAANGNRANGDIATSSYVGNGQLFILGNANQDTDEYDRHVVTHEWGHYFEDQLSRSDSMGGPHLTDERLDPRIAMGEGFGNAIAGIVMDDPFYRDSSGNQQSAGFAINVETNNPTGWYDEATVQSVIYDLYDINNDGNDNITLGFGPIYETLTATDYKQQPLFTTIYSFLAELKSQQPSSAALIETMAAARGINSTSADGVGETNSGSITSSLPVYKQVAVNGGAVQVCSVNDNGVFNKLGNRAFLAFTAASAGAHTLTMTRSSGASSRDPDFILYKNGTVIRRAESAAGESDTATLNLTAGAHVIDAYDFFNLGLGSSASGDSCYNFTVTR